MCAACVRVCMASEGAIVCVCECETKKHSVCVFVCVSYLRPMRILCLWLMMIKCLVDLLCRNCFHETGRKRDRERGGPEMNQSYLWLMRERDSENERESARDFIRVYAYKCYVGSFPSALSLALSLS